MKVLESILSSFGYRKVSETRSAEDPAQPITVETLEQIGNLNPKYPKFGAIWKAVLLLSNSVAKLPFDVYKRNGDAREIDHLHPLYDLLKYEPNQEQTSFSFKQLVTYQAVYNGNGYALIVRDKYFQPEALIWLDANKTFPVRENGNLWFVTEINNRMHKLEPFRVLHIRGLGDDLVGYSIKQMAAVSFDLSEAAQKYTKKFFTNSARPSVILECPNLLDDEAVIRLRNQWERMFRGVNNAHKTAVLEQGTKATPFSTSVKDAQTVELLKFQILDIANWFNLPAYRLGADIATSYKSLEQENMSFLADSVDPWLVIWEQETRKKGLTEAEKRADSHFVEFNRNALVRTDMRTRFEAYNKATGGAPIMIVNEIRKRENLPPATDPRADSLQWPSNNFDPDKSNYKAARNDALAAARANLQHIFDRMLTRVKKDFTHAVRKDEVSLFLDSFATKHEPVILREFTPVCNVIDAITGEPGSITAAMSEFKTKMQAG